MSNKCVHTEHCCVLHGCKYGDDDECPVVNGSKIQSYECEICESGHLGHYKNVAPKEPTLKTKYIKMYMTMAMAAADASECVRSKVGCVILTPNKMVSTGLNGTPEGYHTNVCELEDNTTNPHVRHAERAALDKMLAEGVKAKDSLVFVTLSPCVECAKSLHGAQVKHVYFKDEYRCDAGLRYLDEVGIPYTKFDMGC